MQNKIYISDTHAILIALYLSLLLVFMLLFVALPRLEVSGVPPSVQDLQNTTRIKTFCGMNGYPDGTSHYLNTYKNHYGMTFFEIKAKGTSFGENSIYCYGNNTGSFYQRQYREWAEAQKGDLND